MRNEIVVDKLEATYFMGQKVLGEGCLPCTICHLLPAMDLGEITTISQEVLEAFGHLSPRLASHCNRRVR